MFESFIGINFWTAFFVLMNTLAIFFVAKKFLFVPVKNMIDSRQKEIDAMYDAAGAAKESAQALENEYKEKLAQAQQTSDRMVKEAVARGQNRQDEIISQANAGEKNPALVFVQGSGWQPQKIKLYMPKRELSLIRQQLISLRKRKKHSTMPRTRFLKWLWRLQRRLLAVS